VPSRVSPTEKIRGEIDALFGSGRELSEVLEGVARLGARLIMQAEVEEFLGRARYQRRSEVPDARPGSRHGYCPTTVMTTAGPIILARAEAARQRREVRLPVVRRRRVQDERVGDPGDRRVRA
jgi:putative transposase